MNYKGLDRQEIKVAMLLSLAGLLINIIVGSYHLYQDNMTGALIWYGFGLIWAFVSIKKYFTYRRISDGN